MLWMALLQGESEGHGIADFDRLVPLPACCEGGETARDPQRFFVQERVCSSQYGHITHTAVSVDHEFDDDHALDAFSPGLFGILGVFRNESRNAGFCANPRLITCKALATRPNGHFFYNDLDGRSI